MKGNRKWEIGNRSSKINSLLPKVSKQTRTNKRRKQMTASATIDITTYTNPTAGTTSSTKTYAANNSVDFANALDSANKNYSADDTTSTIVNSNPHSKIFKTQNNDKKSDNVKDSSSNNVKEKTNFADTDTKNKIEDKSSQNDNTKTAKQAGDAVQENNTNKDIKKPQEQEKNSNSDSDSESKSDSQSDSNSQQNQQSNQQGNPQENQKGNQQNSPQDNQQPNQQVNQELVTQQLDPQVNQQPTPPVINQQIDPQVNQQPNQPVTNQQDTTAKTDDTKKTDVNSNINNNVALPIENIVASLSTAIQTEVANTTVNTNQPVAVQNNQAPAETQALQQDLNIDLTNITDNLANKIANATNNIKVQPQTQQALSNVEINPQAPQQAKIQTQGQPQAQLQPQTAQVTDTTTSQTPAPQTPVIEVNTNIIASDVNVVKSLPNENSKQDIQNVLSKTASIQEAIDKTNAKIVTVDTATTPDSNSDSNNLLNKQNAQEQVVKIALENNNGSNKTPDVSQNVVKEAPLDIAQNTQNIQNATLSTHDTTTQTIFTQTLNNAQAQQSKDLDKTDILSQINNQLNTKQIQTGETTKVNIILQPENLGKITLELINSKEGLTAKMTTDNEQVKELLSKHLDNLKDTLSNQGVNVSNITVKVEETQKQSNNQSAFENWQAKQGNQEFSNNAQNKGENGFQDDFFSDEQTGNTAAADADADADIDMNTESGAISNRSVENTVSISTGSNSTRVDYKV